MKNPDNPFGFWKAFLPLETIEILKERSRVTGVPISRLIAFAVDNELDAPNPFCYLTELPDNVYIEGAYMDQAQKILRFLQKFPSGIGRDMLMLCRRDMSVGNKQNFLLGLRELYETNMIVDSKPPSTTKFKNYPPGYKYIQLVHVDRDALIKRKRKLAEQAAKDYQAQIEAFEEKQKKYKEALDEQD
jgi:hypothetical protein